MKKLLTLIGLVSALSVSAETASVVVSSTGMSNMVPSSAKVTQILVTSPANNTASIKLIDSITNILAYTNSAYSTLGSYATNYITTYTNFFGATNSITNIALVDFSNYVAAASYSYPTLATVTVPTNQTIVLQGQQLFFNNAVWCTNLGSGNATVTLNYVNR